MHDDGEKNGPALKLALMLGAILAAVAFCEILVRTLVSDPLLPRRTEPAGIQAFEKTPKGLEVYRPGISFAHIYDSRGDDRGYLGPSGRIDYRINRHRLRGAEFSVQKQHGTRRILCLGDSFTFGEGVREEDTWPRQVEKILGQGNEVINAGIQGYDLEREAIYLLLYGRQLDPDVVVLGFFLNDLMPFQETIGFHTSAVSEETPPSRMARVSKLWALLEGRHVAKGQQIEYFEALRQSFSSEKWEQQRIRLGRFREMADHDGFEILVLLFPLLYELDDYPFADIHQQVSAAFEEAGVSVIDLLGSYRSYSGQELWVHPIDPHPNEIAQGIAAEQVAKWLRGVS